MKNKNISFQLSIYFLISETILSVIIILFGYSYVRDSLLESYRYRLQYDVQEVLDNVKNSMDDAVRLTDNLESDFDQRYLQKNPQKYIEMVFKGQPDMQAFAVVTSVSDGRSKPISDFRLFRSGEVIKSDTGRFYSNHAKTDEWKKQMLLNSKPEWSAPFYSPEMGSRLMIYAHPFDYTKDERSLHATIFCTVSLDRNLGNLKHQEKLKSGFSIILDEQNNIIYHPDSTKTGKEASSILGYFGDSQNDIIKLLTDRISGYQKIHTRRMKDKGKVAIYWPVKSTKWFMITIIPENLFMSELKRMTLALILLILFIGSITSPVAIYFSIRLVSPITVLADDSRKIMEAAGVDPVHQSNNSGILSDSESLLPMGQKYADSHLNDLRVLTDNMEKMKERLALYRKDSIQSSLD